MTAPIVLATDGSEIASHATTAAAWLASSLDLPVEVVNVANVRGYSQALAELDRVTENRREALREGGQQALDQARDRLADLGVTAKTQLVEGSPSDVLVDHAEDVDAWALVLGTHGRGGIARAILGSIADRVVRSARVPTLTVREPIESPHQHPDTILVPSDGSKAALAAGEKAIAWAQATGAQVDLLHAITPPLEGDPYLAGDPRLEELHNELVQEALTPLAQQATDAGVDHRQLEAHGRPHDVVLDRIEEGKADAVAMGTEGRGGLQRFLLGSQADKVIRASPAPVLSVRPPET